MLLDNEKQKNFMLGLINAVPISGTYPQIRGTIASFDDLIVAVTNAQVMTPNPVQQEAQEQPGETGSDRKKESGDGA